MLSHWYNHDLHVCFRRESDDAIAPRPRHVPALDARPLRPDGGQRCGHLLLPVWSSLPGVQREEEEDQRAAEEVPGNYNQWQIGFEIIELY